MVRILLALLVLLNLSSCAIPPKATAEKNQQERACIKQCEVVKQDCLKRCEYSCKQCDAQAHKKMVDRYQQYIHEQCVKGERVSLQLQSFRDPLECRKVSCNCSADQRVCVGQCKGNIRKRLQVKPFCC